MVTRPADHQRSLSGRGCLRLLRPRLLVGGTDSPRWFRSVLPGNAQLSEGDSCRTRHIADSPLQEARTSMNAPTMAQIAMAAGVSTAAVSYALNGRPGVSQATRVRICQVAADLGWQPPSRWRSEFDSDDRLVGLLVPRDTSTLHSESFLTGFLSGLEPRLSGYGRSLVIQFAADPAAQLDIYRAWARRELCGTVIVLDLEHDDPRPHYLPGMGFRTVLASMPRREMGVPTIFRDDRNDMRTILGALTSAGGTRFARVSGPGRYIYVDERKKGWEAFFGRRPNVRSLGCIEAQWTGRDASAITHHLLTSAEPPDTIVYDSDVMALAGLRLCQAMGLRIPQDVQLASFDDSQRCRQAPIPVSALRRDPAIFGDIVAQIAVSETTRCMEVMPLAEFVGRRSTRTNCSSDCA